MRRQSTKQATLSDVAARAGVSRTAAAKVMLGTGGDRVRVSDQTRRRVESAASDLKYRPNRAAQQLRGARSGLLGVLLDTVNKPVMYERLSALEDEAAARGYRLLIAQTRHDPPSIADYLREMDGYGVEGLICLFDVARGLRQQIAPLFRDRTHVIAHGFPLHAEGFCVRVDTAHAIRAAVGHLADTGRRRIGMELWNLDDELMGLRAEGYRCEHRGRGLAVDERLVWSAQSVSARPSDEAINRAVAHLVGTMGADAIIASNDIWAVRFIQRLKARGVRVPEDVAVVGYDNLDIGTVVEPNLTTVDQCHDQYAREMMEMVAALVAGTADDQGTRVRVVLPRLIIRDST